MAIKHTILCIGCETEESIDSLLSFTRLTSKSMKKVFYRHYVDGMEAATACFVYSVPLCNFLRDSTVIMEVARKISNHNEIKYTEIKYKERKK